MLKLLVKDVVRRRDRIVSKVKTRYWQKTHKFGIIIPKKVKEALDIDKATGTNFGELNIQKEMDNARIAFDKVTNTVKEMMDVNFPPGYQDIRCHMIFDINMDRNFNRKYCFVPGGHTPDPPVPITYSSVVYRGSMRVVFIIAALNDIDVLASNIFNAYLNAPCCEKIYTKSGPEFGT